MKIGHDGLPVLGAYSKDTALAGYICSRGSKFLREISAAIEIISDGFSAKSRKLEELGYTGEIDFLAKKMNVRWEVLDDVELGRLGLLWINPVMLKRLSQDTINQVDEVLTIKALRDGGGLEPPSFKGKSFQQRVDIIAHDLRSGQDLFSNLSVSELLSVLSSAKANDPDVRRYVSFTSIDSFYDKSDEEFAAFERFRGSRSGRRSTREGDHELVQDLASRVATEVGCLEIVTYSYISHINDFSMVVKRLITVELAQENIVEDFFTPYAVRDGEYSKLHSWTGVVELE
jgi:hypothetical protein